MEQWFMVPVTLNVVESSSEIPSLLRSDERTVARQVYVPLPSGTTELETNMLSII